MSDDTYETVRGEKVRLPSIPLAHCQIKGNILMAVGKHLIENKRGYFFGNVYVRFDDENIFMPDFCVVLKEHEQILANRVYIDGAPDMVVEVLSKSTRKKDITVKKDTYEVNGVREYWIVDPWAKSIDVYLLRDGKYFLSDVYTLFDEKDLALLDDNEKAEVKHEVPVTILDGLKIPLNFIFKWGYR